MLRRTAVGLSNYAATLTTFGYDAASRLGSVTNGSQTVSYTYWVNSPLVQNLAFKQNGTTRMTTSKSYDYLNRLQTISSAPSASGLAPIAFNYTYNNANQRMRTVLADGSFWIYEYDSLGQVKSGKRYWPDWTPVAGQQFEYGFDDIGNRTSTKAGGDQNGGFLRQANYYANNLNQYTNRTVPGTNDVIGVAFATNSVTVNGVTAYRKVEYFQALAGTNNASAPAWLGVTVSSGGQSVTGHVLVAQSPESFTYDADGNLTSDSLWTNTWNGENRLVATESRSSVPAAARAREEWTHLPDGRWIQRIVSTNNGSAFYPAFTNRYVWDGQVLLAVLDHTNGLVMSFMRGLDLSGTMQGAGGVGGLLTVVVGPAVPSGPGVHFACYDGNGNVAALVSAADGTVSANYEYDPFGQTIRLTGPVAKANPIRFSTQYADDVTGDVKYLHRDYRPALGRWLSRDPIGEQSFRSRYLYSLSPKDRHAAQTRRPSGNEFGFVNNQPPNLVDLLGLTTWKGKCRFASASWPEGPGGMIIDCDLVSLCEVGDDNHREYAHAVGFFFELSVSIPIEFTVSDTTFKTPEKTGYKAFRGFAGFVNIGWAGGKEGYALYKVKLGDGVSEGIGSEQLGLALGESAGVGFSISKGRKECCN